MCRGRIDYPPTLFFRDDHIVRHRGGGEHHTDCEFFKTADDQVKLVGTYKPRRDRKYTLLKPFNDFTSLRPGHTSRRTEGRTRSRSTLASLLVDLWENAGLQDYYLGSVRPAIEKQIALVEAAASNLYIHDDVTVESVLCTDARELESFKVSLLQRQWPDGVRPQGVFISVVTSIRDGAVVTYPSETEVSVRDRMAIFGELSPDDQDFGEDDDPNLAEGDESVGVRKHYVCIASLGQSIPRGPVDVLSCYLHPCYKLEDMMLVDSGYERITLNQIVSTAIGLRNSKIFIDVTKPMFDISDEPRRRDGRARPALIPDFVVWSEHRKVIVETLGYRSPTYRARKDIVIPEMQAALDGAEVVCIDFQRAGVHLKQLKKDFREELAKIFLST